LPADVQAKLKELDKLKADNAKREREAMDETERLRADLADANARALDATRKAIAAREGIPAELAGRLTGATEEEIAADAKLMATFLKAPPKPADTGAAEGGDPPPAPNDSEIQKLEKQLEEARKKGDAMADLRLQREIANLKTRQGK
jgi:hypothetical protein